MFSDCPFCILRHKTTILYYTTRKRKSQHLFNNCGEVLRGNFTQWQWGERGATGGLAPEKTGEKEKTKCCSYPKHWKIRIFFANFEISLAFFCEYRYNNKHLQKVCLKKTERHGALLYRKLQRAKRKSGFWRVYFHV